MRAQPVGRKIALDSQHTCVYVSGDFGLSIIRQSVRASKQSVITKAVAETAGTLQYLAPELQREAEGDEEIEHTAASDVYSLGILMWSVSSTGGEAMICSRDACLRILPAHSPLRSRVSYW